MTTAAHFDESSPRPPGTAAPKKARKSGTGVVWTGLVLSALIGIVLLIFILQNMERMKVELFFWHFTLPLGVGILLAAICGGIIMAVLGGFRMWQMRRAAKRT